MTVSFWTFLIVLLLVLSSSTSSSDEEEEKDEDKYLYNGPEAFPVMDYHGDDAADPLRPDFLYDLNAAKLPRVVEFYAPWCPHCRHFKNHYIAFAKQMKQVTAEMGIVVEVRAVSCQAFRTICRDFDVHSYPKVKLFAAGSTNATAEISYWKVHPFEVLHRLGVSVDHLRLDVEEEEQPLHHPQAQSSAELTTFRRTKQQVFDDAHLSLHFSLENGVFTSNGPLSNKTSDALWYWLDLLKEALPPAWSAQTLIKELLDKFDNVTQSEEQFMNIVQQHKPPVSKWSQSCTKGVDGMGYTCGLWQLFHIMTVGVVEWNLMISTDDTDDMVINVARAANKLRDFVEHFFGCEVCRVNFLAAYDSCFLDRCHRLKNEQGELKEWIQLPVWLFETHNAVNVRLLKEQHERDGLALPTHEQEIAKQWPSRAECPKCWNEDGGWNDLTIYKFLRTEYWPEDNIAKDYRKELQQPGSTTGEAEHEFDYLEEDAMPPLALQLVPFAIIVGLAVGWKLKKEARRKSGWHKKDDSFLYYNGV